MSIILVCHIRKLIEEPQCLETFRKDRNYNFECSRVFNNNYNFLKFKYQNKMKIDKPTINLNTLFPNNQT